MAVSFFRVPGITNDNGEGPLGGKSFAYRIDSALRLSDTPEWKS